MRVRVESFTPINKGGRYIIIVIEMNTEVLGTINERIFCCQSLLETKLLSTDVILLIKKLKHLLF